MTLGGSNIWSIQMARHLAARRSPVALIEHTAVDWHPPFAPAIPPAVRRIVCPGKTPFKAGLRDLREYVEIYRTALPAVLIPNFSDAAYAACARLSQTDAERLRMIAVAHGNAENYFRFAEYYEPGIHAFIAVSDEIAAELRRRLPQRTADIHVRACAVDVPADLERDWTGPGQPLRLVYAGRITDHEKKVSNFLPLFKALGWLGVDFQFQIIGDGGYRKWLEYEISQLPPDLRARVALVGMKLPEEMPAIWRTADVCILVSDSEGTAVSMLEAMAEGCVPVVTRVSGTAAVIHDGENGFAVPRGDMETMARVIQQLATKRDRLSVVGRAAHATARERYSYAAYVPWFMELMEAVWAMPPRCWDSARRLMPVQPPKWLADIKQRMVNRGWHGLTRIKASVKST